MRPVRPALLLLLGLLLGCWLTWWHPLPRAVAQGVGFFGTSTTGTRTNCAALTGAVVGQTVCLDQAANAWKYYTGASQTTAQWVSGVASLTGVNNVKDFGAKGDGVTDDSTAIQAAITAAAGRPVFVPAGTYVVGTALTYTTSGNTQGLQLYGEGQRRTLFDTRVNGTMLTIDGGGTPNAFAFGARLRDFAIISTATPVTSNGISFRAQWDWVIDAIRVQGLNGTGLIGVSSGDPDSSAYFTISRSWFFQNTGWGVDFQDTGLSIALGQIRDNYITSNTTGGMRVSGQILELRGNTFANNGSFGLHIKDGAGSSPRNIAIYDNEFQSNVTANLKLEYGVGIEGGRNHFYADNSFPLSTFRPPVSVNIGSGSTSNVRFSGDTIRVQNRGTNFHTVYQVGPNATATVINSPFFSALDGASRWTDTGAQSSFFDNNAAIRGVLSNQTTTTSGSYTPDTLVSTYHRVVINGTGAFTVNNPTGGEVGRELILDIFNQSGGTIAVTFGGDFTVQGYANPITGERTNARFFFQPGSLTWVQVGPWSWGPGLQVGAATGGNQGVGTINVSSAVAVNGVPMLRTGLPTCTNNCGTSPSVAGNNTAMRVTMGATGTPRSPFLVLFNGAWNATPSCIAQLTTATTTTVSVTNATTTGVTVNTVIGPAQGDVYAIHCLGVG